MKKRYLLTAFIFAGLQPFIQAAEQKVGIVNFNNCITDTKLGKQEQATLESTRKQFATLLEDTHKQFTELKQQLDNKDYLDGLSPDAIQELRNKTAQLEEELNRYNQQYYQFLNQGQYKLIQTVVGGINQAAEKVAASKGYSLIMNKEMCFFYSPSLDVTAAVVQEMDKNYEVDAKAQTPPVTPTAVETKKAETPAAAKEEPKQAEAPVAVKEEAKKPAAPVAAPVATKEEPKKAPVAAKEEGKKNAANPAKSR